MGHVSREMRTYGTGPTAQRRYGWTGAPPAAASQFVDDLMRVIKASYP